MLKQWLKASKTTQADLARRLGSGRLVVWRYLQGRLPAPHAIAAIYEITKGAVTANDWYGHAKSKRRAA